MAQKNTKKGSAKKTTTKKKVVKNTTPKKETIKKETVKKTVPKKEVVEVKEPEVVEIKKEEVKVEKKNIFTKRNIIIIVVLLVIINVLVGSILIYNNPKNKIKRSIKAMGTDFYTNYFYDTLASGRTKKELSEILERYKDTGIKVNLKSLSQFNSSKYKEDIDSFAGENKACNLNKTRVIVYPKAPYEKNNYKIIVELDCNY